MSQFDFFYAYTIGQIIFNCFIDKISNFIQYSLKNSLITTSAVQLIAISLLSLKWINRKYTYRLSEKTIFYLIILTITIGLKHNVRIYAKSVNIPLYRNYVFKTLYFALKPFINQYGTIMPKYNVFINLAHFISVLPILITERSALSGITLFTTLYELVDLFVLDELETKFYLQMLMPEIYLFIQYFGEFLANIFTMYQDGITIEPMFNADYIVTLCFILFEALIILSTLLNTRVNKYTIQRQRILLQLDAHVSNTVDIVFNCISSILNIGKIYIDNIPYYIFNRKDLLNGVICILHLFLYLSELILHHY